MDLICRCVREILSTIGITTCSKCLAHTKIKYDGHTEYGVRKGFTICPKCGQRDSWNDDDVAN